MKDVGALVSLARSDDVYPDLRQDAFAELVERFQDMAYGCALALLGDAHAAQDAAQEAFIAAYRNLPQLQEPAAFPGWFRRIVLTSCHRQTRAARFPTQSIAAGPDLATDQPGPPALAEREELKAQIAEAIRSLPERQRLATVLYYIDGYSQAEVADFLEVPEAVVKERLHRARRALRERMLSMVQDDIQAERPSNDDSFARAVRLATALETAAVDGQLALLEALLVDGLDVNARNVDGGTLLHWAATKGSADAVEWLLAHGADPSIADRAGCTPLDRALEQGHTRLASLLRGPARPSSQQ